MSADETVNRSIRLVNVQVDHELREPVYVQMSKRADEWPRLVHQISVDTPGGDGALLESDVGNDSDMGFTAEFWCGFSDSDWRGHFRFRSEQTGDCTFVIKYGAEARMLHVSHGHWELALVDPADKAVPIVHSMRVRDLPPGV